MKNFLRFVASAALSLMLVTGVSLSLTGCSAETLSGPDFESYGTETGGGTSGGSGSDHNYDYDKTETGGGTSGGSGSDHNYDYD